MLSNAYFLATFRVDTAENEPAKNCVENIAAKILAWKTSRRRRRRGGEAPDAAAEPPRPAPPEESVLAAMLLPGRVRRRTSDP